MRSRERKLALLFLAGALALGVVAFGSAGGQDSLGGEHVGGPTSANICNGSVGGNAVGMANPAAVYCRELGYEYSIVDTDQGEEGVCAFPNGDECNDWGFLQGKCGRAYSYCARQGYDTVTKNDGKGPFSREYSVCVRDRKEIGVAAELMGLSQKSTRGTLPVEPSGDVPEGGLSVGAVPGSFDWRTYGGQNWMTSVKNQGSCGSCWAFSAVGVVEATYNIAMGNPNLDLDLSEEYLVSDCLPGQACCGGWMETALSFIRDQGIPDEACLPYVDLSSCTCPGGACNSNCTYRTGGSCSDATCSNRCSDWQDRLVNVETVGEASASQMKQTLVDNGPLSVAMGIGSSYGGYWDGDIYRCTNDSGINHGVVIAGYSDSGGYWIVKNSWGSAWNGDGYLKVGYAECAIENYINYVEAAPASDQDGDGVPDASDNCPASYNPDQIDTDGDGLGDVCDDDDDSDDYTDVEELAIGTDPTDDCSDQPGDGDAWPPDITRDTYVGAADILLFRPMINPQGGGSYNARFDLKFDGRINIQDILMFRPVISTGCI